MSKQSNEDLHNHMNDLNLADNEDYLAGKELEEQVSRIYENHRLQKNLKEKKLEKNN